MIRLLSAIVLFIAGISSVIAAESQSQTELANQLLQKLQERDKIIFNLQERVQNLEKRMGASSPVKTTAKTPPPQQKIQTKTASAKPKSKVGSFEVDEIAAERALERTLVQSGALLLPFGQGEIQPFVTYTRSETDLLAVDTAGNIGNIDKRRNVIDAGVFMRAGLPYETQLELSIPARIVNETQVFRENELLDSSAYALGDIRIGIAKTLMHEDGWIPDLVGRITWDTDSGEVRDNEIEMGSGFNDLIVSVTALKRQDPLAFTGSFSYQKTFKKFGIEPGDKYRFSMNASLAASPQTSLSIGLQQTFSEVAERNNVKITSTDNTISSALTFGASSTIGRRLFFSVLAGIGLTDSSPDYFVNVSVPLRFDIPLQSIANF